ncbi:MULTISPECIES: YqjD family protein [unclassified Thalassospira]|jgi:ElaB/YqjD/DUF883 family membrane-anchored ribosome-binding protein|uniref:DUF883 family protein n=1 Tax=unclassified Thalassospira TaxID=2648997 RepID=UPI000A1E999A|nr:DUF883 family protein [Thalassospira sp. MCCC 1A01428]OSQ44828.1 hypothetical protein THS27_06730 [Thalassospira sp. MCCC 1A01428]
MVAKNEADTSADTSKLQAEVEILRQDLAEVTKTLKTIARETGETRAAQAAQRVREVSGQAREQFDHARDVAVDQVRERPLITVAATFGVGLLIGRLLQR